MFLRNGSTRRQNERLNLDSWMLQVGPAALAPSRWHAGGLGPVAAVNPIVCLSHGCLVSWQGLVRGIRIVQHEMMQPFPHRIL